MAKFVSIKTKLITGVMAMLLVVFLVVLSVITVLNILSARKNLRVSEQTIKSALIAKGKTIGEAKGRQEGAVRGLWIGRISSLQELMGIPPDTLEALSNLPLAELEYRYQQLRRDYDVSFKPR